MRFKTGLKLALLGVSLIGVAGAAPAVAGDVYVIAHPGVALTAAELKDVYLGEKQFVGPIKLVPVDNAAVQGDFLAKALNMEASRYGALWTKKGFRGALAAPAIKSGDTEVIGFVKNTPGAIGYVSAQSGGVKELFKY